MALSMAQNSQLNSRVQDDLLVTNKRARKRILFVNRADSLYDEMFLKSFSSAFDVTCATFNPKPSIGLFNSNFVHMSNPLMFMYKYPNARYLIYSLGHKQIRSVLKATQSDMLVCSYSPTYGFMGAKSDFHPYVLITFGSDLLLAPKNRLLVGRSKLAISRADLILADGPEAKRAVIKLGGDGRKVLDFARFDPRSVCQVKRSNDVPSLRTTLGLKDQRIILHTRWFESLYNVDTVLKGYALARSRFLNVALVLVGSGSLESHLRSLVRTLGISESVYFIGRLPRQVLIPIYDEADVYVSASLSDSMNGSLMEAICRGTPVVVSDSETNREWVEDGVSGTLFNPLSSEELAQRIISVLFEPNKYKEMALVAKSNLLHRIDWQKNEQSMIQRMLEMA